MYNIATLKKISPVGLAHLTDLYTVTDDTSSATGILVRSQDMHEMEFGSSLLGIARAGAGVNNIPLDRCADQGIVVFNTPGANANAVKELVLAGMLLAARNIPSALSWAAGLTGDISKQVEKGKKSLAFSMKYRSGERTLTDEEVDTIHEQVVLKLKDEYNAALREL